MSTVKVNTIDKRTGSTLTLGGSGTAVTLASGATQTGFGRTGTVNWQTTPKTATFTAVSGEGYFANTSGGAFSMNLPSGSAGAIVSVADYAATWQTNNLTIVPNGSDKIGSLNENAVLSTKGQSVTLVFVDSTQGWINTMDSTSNVRGEPAFICASGGTITTSGDFKIHTFNSTSTFTVNAGPTPANNNVSYMVIGGGGGSGSSCGNSAGGGGAAGFREGKTPATPYTASPLVAPAGLPVSIQAYPVTIGAGGAGGPTGENNGVIGANSVFSSITSAGGGFGGGPTPPGVGGPGGSGGGGAGGGNGRAGGSGNTPPVSPPQGNNGGTGPTSGSDTQGGGGGGASAVGTNATGSTSGSGGNGVSTEISASAVTRGGGGAGGANTPAGKGMGSAGSGGGGGTNSNAKGDNGTANTGGGAGGPSSNGSVTGAIGGSGVVIIRYKFQ